MKNQIHNGFFIIIATYNGMTWLKTCLKSCMSYPIIIVDNASTDETVSFIEINYPNITLFKQTKNIGFGQANNIGIRYALTQGAEHVFLLNQDAYIMNDALDQLVRFQKANSEYGILSPIHITGDKKKLDKNFSNFMRKEKTKQFYSDFVLGRELAKVYEVPFVNAAAWLISRKCLETVGGFDPLFFHYGEDDNFCQRILYHGFNIGVLPRCYIIHDRENSKKEQPKAFSELYYKNAETQYKARFANILLPNTIDKKIKYLKRLILKAQLKLEFNNAIGIKNELNILRKLEPQIQISRERNVLKQNHYL